MSKQLNGLKRSKMLFILLSCVLLFVSALGFQVSESVLAKDKQASAYDDLFDGDWKIPYANWGVERGVITPYKDNTIRVGEEITEAEFMNILANYIGLNKNTKVDYTKDTDKLYKDLEKIGVVSEGTLTKKYRTRVTTLDDGLLLILSLHDEEKFKNRKAKIVNLINEINKDKKAPKLDLTTSLTKVDILRMLKANESLGNELVLAKPVNTVGKTWKEIYYGDSKMKRISLFEEQSGLLVNINRFKGGFIEDGRFENYYAGITHTSTEINEQPKTDEYFITLTNVGNAAVNLSKYTVLVNGKVVKSSHSKAITLNGKTTVSTLVSGKVQSIKVIVDSSNLEVSASEFDLIKENSFYLTNDDGSLERKSIYVSDNLTDLDYQENDLLYKQHYAKAK